jgi:Ca2+-binding EF-hand superfamily protein
LTIQGNPYTEEGRRQAFELVHQEGEERITFNNFKKIAQMLKLGLNDDQIQDAIQSIAGKGKQHLTWEQFNAFLEKKVEKKRIV